MSTGGRDPSSQGGETPPGGEQGKPDEMSGEIVQHVYTFNKETRQVMKIEELDPKTGQRKEVPMQGYGYSPGSYNPYAGSYDPSGGYGGYEGYGYDPSGGYGGYEGYGYDPSGGYGGYEGYGYDPSGG